MPYFLSPCLPDHHHQFTSSNLMIFRKTSTFVRGTHKTVGVLLFLPDEFMQPTSCFLPISEIPQKAINKENDPDKTCFPGKLHMLLGRAQKHVFFILACYAAPVHICLVPPEEAGTFLYLPLFLQQELNHSSDGGILLMAIEKINKSLKYLT